MRRTLSTRSGPTPSNGPHTRLSGLWVATYFVAAFRAVRQGTLRRLRPETRPQIVGSAAKQQIEGFAVHCGDHREPLRCAIRRGPVAVCEVAVARTVGNLDNGVQRNMFHDFELAHAESPLQVCVAASAGLAAPPVTTTTNGETGLRQVVQENFRFLGSSGGVALLAYLQQP